MTSFGWCTVLLLALGAAVAQAAERGIYTLVDGDARVLRGATWYALVPGARAEEGDVVDAGERAAVQLEFAQGGALNIAGPRACACHRASRIRRQGERAGSDRARARLVQGGGRPEGAGLVRLRLPAATHRPRGRDRRPAR